MKSDGFFSQKDSNFRKSPSKRPPMLGQGQIQDLSGGGGQEFLGTKN